MTGLRVRFAGNRLLFAQIALGATIWILLALNEGYDFDWDVLNYHFYNGYALLHGKTWFNVQPAMRQSYFAPLLDAVFYLLVRHLPSVGVIIVIAAFQSLLYPLLFQIGRFCLAPFVPSIVAQTVLCMLLAVLGIAAPINIWEAGGALGDTTTAVLVITAMMLLARHLSRLDDPRSTRTLAIMGLLAGLAAGLKLTNLPFAIALFVALASQSHRHGFTRLAICLAGMAVAFLLAYGWWGVILVIQLGNPIFPSFNNVFHSPFASFTSFTDPAFLLPAWYDKLLFPFTHTSLSGHLDPAGLFDLRMACALPLSLLTLLAAFRRLPPSARALLVFIPVSYAVWLFAFPINRYLVAVDMLAPLAVTICIATLWRHRSAPWIACAALFVVLPYSASTAWPLFWLPGDHRQPNGTGYFGVRFTPPANLDHAAVAMLGGYPTTFVIPFFPRTTVFTRLQGSLFEDNPNFIGLSAQSSRASLQSVFGNATGSATCRVLADTRKPLFILRPFPLDRPQDEAALKWFGITYDHASCKPVTSKANLQIELCRAARSVHPECLVD